MLKVAEIKVAIENLPEKDFVLLRQWFSEKDWQKWANKALHLSQNPRLFYS
jgi:hypothetical protein